MTIRLAPPLAAALVFLSFAACKSSDSDSNQNPDAGIDPPIDLCGELSALPLTATELTGFSGSEDFAFDAEGNLVSVREGNLTRQSKDGTEKLMSPNIGETAGTRFLSNGDLVIAQVSEGALLRVSPSGSTRVLLSGIAYPNGVEVDQDDFIYVAEHDAGQVRRVHPDTGEFTIVAEGLTNPNGLSFSPDYKTLYINSFGGGTVHSASVTPSGEWEPTKLIGSVPLPEDPCARPDAGPECTAAPCDGKAAGDICVDGDAFMAGLCQGEVDALSCAPEGNGPDLFAEACAGKETDAPCDVTVADTQYAGQCQSFNGPITCWITDNNASSVCSGKAEGDDCVAAEPWLGVYPGKCDTDFGDLWCEPIGLSFGEGGGLDGMTVDACGNVYVTEYILGIVWRFATDGTREKVAELPSSWIPNLHWGVDVGGWDSNILYVMDREEGRLFELPVGVPEKDRVYP